MSGDETRNRLIARAEALHKTLLARADAEQGGDEVVQGLEVFAALVCNSCGLQLVAADSVHLAAAAVLEGWSVGENLGDADLCRGCSS